MTTKSEYSIRISTFCLLLIPLSFIISWIGDVFGSYQEFNIILNLTTYNCNCSYNQIYCNEESITNSCTLIKNSIDTNVSNYANTIIITTSILIVLLFLYSWQYAVILIRDGKNYKRNLKEIYTGTIRTQCVGFIFGIFYIIMYILFIDANNSNDICVINDSNHTLCDNGIWYYVNNSSNNGKSLNLWLLYGIISVVLSVASFIFLLISIYISYSNPINSSYGSIDNTQSNNFKILTWNIYSIPFSPYCLSNPNKCANFLLNVSKNEKWEEFDGLIICGLQEIWSWKTGLFPNIVLTYFISHCEHIPFYIGRIITLLFQFVSLLFGLILKFLPFSYNPKHLFYQTLNRYDQILPYYYYDDYIPLFNRFMDNGLLLLSNQKATKNGFVSYISCACADSMANKGFIWAYFEKYNLLTINTHLQYSKSGKRTIDQINELKTFIDQFIQNENNINIIIFGDFNVDLTNFINKSWQSFMLVCDIPNMLGNKVKKINSYQPTMSMKKNKKWGCLDHIFLNFNIENIEEKMYENGHYSDHLLISNTFTKTRN